MGLSTEKCWDTFLNTLSRDPQKVAKVMYLYLVETGYDHKEATLEVYGHFNFNNASMGSLLIEDVFYGKGMAEYCRLAKTEMMSAGFSTAMADGVLKQLKQYCKDTK